MKSSLDIVIVDAIKMIVEASDGKVNYDVDSFVEDTVFNKKNAVKKMVVKIVITEPI